MKQKRSYSIQNKSLFIIGFAVLGICLLSGFASELMAQEVRGVIDGTIRKMVTLLDVIIIGIMAWTGFLLARGDGSAFQRIVYCVMGLIVVNSAEALLRFFYSF